MEFLYFVVLPFSSDFVYKITYKEMSIFDRINLPLHNILVSTKNYFHFNFMTKIYDDGGSFFVDFYFFQSENKYHFHKQPKL
mgnify:CR=1 FL=1